jgi:hypothetical protein
MTRFSRSSEKDLERLLSGFSAEGPLDDLAAFLHGVRASCAQSPSEDVMGRHLASISEAIRDSRSETRPLVDRSVMTTRAPLWRRAVNKTVSAALKVGAGVVAASMSMIGLAYAGVDLPQQAAANAIEAVTGLELPNQDSEKVDGVQIDRSVSDDVRAIVESRDSYESGCEFGRAVTAAATQNSQGQGGHAKKGCHSEKAVGTRRDEAATGAVKSAHGKARAATGSSHAARGKSKAAEKSDGASEPNAARGKTKASEKSGGASDVRSNNATGGWSNASRRSQADSDAPLRASERPGENGVGNALPGPGGPTTSEPSHNGQPLRP